MKMPRTANQFVGRAIGSLFFAGFGSLWLFLALYVREQLNVTTISPVVAGLLLLVVAALYLRGQAKRWPRVPDDPSVQRTFNRVNAIQWVAAFIAIYTLKRLHLDAYSVSAIAVIVGLHLFPLARTFRNPLHYVTGALLVAWAIGTAALVPIDRLQGATALGTGVILWLAAAVALAATIPAVRQSIPVQASAQTGSEPI